MTRFGRFFLASVIGCALTLSVPVQVAAGPAEPALALAPRALSSAVWYFEGASGMASPANRGFTSNAGFVVTPEGVVVFDALGTPALAEAMLAAIRKITPQPVRYVILSHYHADHFYGLQVFKAAGATIWARREGRQYLASDLARERLAQRRHYLSPWVNDQTQLLPADRWLDFPTTQPIPFALGGTRFDLISGGNSHAPGDLMLLVPDQGVLFAGDLFFTGRLPFVVDGNTREWLAALSRIEHSAPRIVVPGHGSASLHVSEDLKVTRAYLEFLRAQLGAAVENLQSFDEAYAGIDWSEFAGLPTFDVANRRNAYSVYLEMQAELLGGAPH
jgi:glyoxylase-like metal-dependent hydrolase (beta-lactamase superfamily II)